MPECQVGDCNAFASYLCVSCHKYMCMHRHMRRRKVNEQWLSICSECAEKVDRKRKAERMFK